MEPRGFSRPETARIHLPMHPAKAAILNNALAPLWRRLRTWVEIALGDRREQLPQAELGALRANVFEIEALLRRLVLVAATALSLGIQARWSPQPRTAAKTRAKHGARRIVRAQTFRLYTIRWSKTDASLTTTIAIEQRGETQQTHLHTNSPSDTLTSGSPKPHQGKPHKGRGAGHRAYISKDDPDMTVEDFERWCAANPLTETSAQAAWRQEQEILAELERAGQPARRPHNPTGKRIERKAAPELHDATSLRARAAFLAELAANPHALIQRAARAMARRREIAYRLSLIAAPKARGALATSIAMCAVIIPFHNDFVEVMQRFALSHTEPDTT